jgi:hypothetical protein
MKLDFTNGINNTMSSTQYYVWKTVKDEKGITFVKQTLDVFFCIGQASLKINIDIC